MSRIHPLLLSAVLLAAPPFTRVASAQVAPDPDLQAALERGRAELDALGVSAAIVFADGSRWEGAAGEAAPDVPLTAEAAFQMGSVTKVYTATLVLRLTEQDPTVLDRSLDHWFPELPGSSSATVRMALHHTSGLADVFQEEGFSRGLFMNPLRVWTPAEILALTGAPTFEAGSGWGYSSTGYVALAALLEREMGDRYATLVRRELIDPAGLDRTWVGGFEDPAPPLAHGMLDINGDGSVEDLTSLVPATGFLTASGGAGALIATPGDVAHWLHSLMSGRVLQQKTLEEMQTWVERPDGNRHGLGLLRVEREGRILIGHRGNTGGFSAAAWHLPGRDLTIVVASNRNGVHVTPVVDALLDAVGTEDAPIR